MLLKYSVGLLALSSPCTKKKSVELCDLHSQLSMLYQGQRARQPLLLAHSGTVTSGMVLLSFLQHAVFFFLYLFFSFYF